MTIMRWIPLVMLLSGCFPYRETYRHAIDGVVVNEAGAPLAKVRVESCSATHWDHHCKYRGNTTTDGSGRFHFGVIKEWDWCCWGEAPLPYTVYAACAPEGGVLRGKILKPDSEPFTLDGSEAEWAKKACATSSP
jgi:hypothetical protein